jgi:formylmethanofuran dehydrogenase subunit D
MGLKANVVTGRSLGQGSYVDDKLSKEYFEAVSICEVNPEDCEYLSIEEGDRVKITTEFGSVVLSVKKNKDIPSGVVFVPMGPYANQIIDPETTGTGMPQFKGIDATIEKTDEKVLEVNELIENVISR